jgi:hypothetical protein
MTPLAMGRKSVARVLILILGLLMVTPLRGAENVFDVRDFGARPDGKTLCTAAIQKAVDACAAGGGGTVYLPPGTLRSGTVFLKSHVTLLLESGCTLLGSENLEDYPRNVPAVRSYTDNYVDRSLIAGENLQNVAIRGRGTIDGNGGKFRWPQYLTRPYAIRLVRCRDVLIEGVTMRSSAMWMQHYLACDGLTMRGVTVYNHATHNNDGLDLDGCHDVCVSDCTFDSDDDAITLKSTLNLACEDVTIINCTASSHCNAIKMGTESNGGFKNVTIANCAIRSPRVSQPINGSKRGLAGIALEIVDGGELDRVAISNITMTGVSVPLFMRLGNRARPFEKAGPKPAVGTFRNVTVSNVIATGASKTGCSITGLPGHPIENVVLSNLNLTFDGGGTAADASRQIPELPEKYPESSMFGTLPAYGLYCRHVKNLQVHNVQLRSVEPDLRQPVIRDDVVVAGNDSRRAEQVVETVSVLCVEDQPRNLPPFWKSRLSDVDAAVRDVKKGNVEIVAKSAGGRNIYLVSYGEKPRWNSSANYNSAVAGLDPASYARKDGTQRPVVLLLGPVHGSEFEGVVGMVNLLHVAETGRDLRARPWKRLSENLAKCRVLIVPCGNPDGRARCRFDSWVGEELSTHERATMGTRPDGMNYQWPSVKRIHPMRGAPVGSLGAYFNDEGVNLMHDEWFAPMAPETRAWFKLAREEAPDFIVSLHSHASDPSVEPTAYVPRAVKETIKQFGDRLQKRYAEAGLPHRSGGPEPKEDGATFPPPPFNLTSALCHACGAVSLVFECCVGVKTKPYATLTHEQILDLQLLMADELLQFAVEHPVKWTR